jgi:hypothetical protein
MLDPAPLTSLTWAEIGKLLHHLWYYFGLVVAFGLLTLTSMAVIPSLVSTSALPKSANLLRFSLFITGLGLLVLALVVLGSIIEIAHLLDKIYDRYWI